MENLSEFFVFIDGSVNTRLKFGYGAFLLVTDIDQPIERLKPQISLKRFEQTSSTILELQTSIWALGMLDKSKNKITVYTDSQNIVSLPDRHRALVEKNYFTAKNKPHNHRFLYQEFFSVIENLNCTFVKIKGHRPSEQKSKIEKIFSLVDRATRNAIRNC